jgi:hypothetical protein
MKQNKKKKKKNYFKLHEILMMNYFLFWDINDINMNQA